MHEFPKRKQVRLKEYDYSAAGYYFVTVCVNGRAETFGKIADGKMVLNEAGKIVRECWEKISVDFENIGLDEYCIMPNHIHGIIIIGRGLIYQTSNKPKNQNDINGYNSDQITSGMINHAPTNWMLMKNAETTLGKIVRYFKARAARIIHDCNMDDFRWQRNYYDHIIRNEKSLQEIREYIVENPAKWDDDEYNIENCKLTRNNGQTLRSVPTEQILKIRS